MLEYIDYIKYRYTLIEHIQNNFYYILMCMFWDTVCTIQVPNVAFYSEYKFEMI